MFSKNGGIGVVAGTALGLGLLFGSGAVGAAGAIQLEIAPSAIASIAPSAYVGGGGAYQAQILSDPDGIAPSASKSSTAAIQPESISPERAILVAAFQAVFPSSFTKE